MSRLDKAAGLILLGIIGIAISSWIRTPSETPKYTCVNPNPDLEMVCAGPEFPCVEQAEMWGLYGRYWACSAARSDTNGSSYGEWFEIRYGALLRIQCSTGLYTAVTHAPIGDLLSREGFLWEMPTLAIESGKTPSLTCLFVKADHTRPDNPSEVN